MNNNEVLKKLRVALQLRDDQIVDILKLADFNMDKSELNAFFRNQDHPNYMECGDQVIRNFLNGLIVHLRGTKENPKNPNDVLEENRKNLGKKVPVSNVAKPAAKKPAFQQNNKNKKSSPKVSVVEKVRYKNGKNDKA